jgi:hypothetical protein
MNLLKFLIMYTVGLQEEAPIHSLNCV